MPYSHVVTSETLHCYTADCRLVHSLLEAISDNTVMQGLLGINSLGEQQHFLSAVMKILAMHPDVRVSVQSVDF